MSSIRITTSGRSASEAELKGRIVEYLLYDQPFSKETTISILNAIGGVSIEVEK